MPLFTYVVTYDGDSHVVQARRSNHKGFVDWTKFPASAFSSLNRELMQALVGQAYRAPFEPVPNREKVWKQTILVESKPFVVYAIQTDG
ncbi:MAG TPA: hypothetical protein VJ476_06600 [Rhizomicrobium sp.]|nr:hypothetical protein [Rhizomicrobium sp.]